MANSIGKFWLPDFSKEAHFVVHMWPAGFKINGTVPDKGALFDKSSVDERTLNRMYYDRWIAMVDELPPPRTTREVQTQMNFMSVNEMNLMAIRDRNASSS